MSELMNVQDMLSRLIAFPSVSKDSNLELIDFIKTYLKKYNIESELVYNTNHTKANLLASIGPAKEGGVVLSGHTDVVPVVGQQWNTDPFVLTKRNEKLYGRGSCDMKGFIACVLAKVPQMVETKLNYPIHFAFSYDEEVGCLGVPSLIKLILKKTPRPNSVIVGEPTEMKVVTAHKGVTAVNVRIYGKEAHSSQTQIGLSAIMVAGKLIHFIEQMNIKSSRKNNNTSEFKPNHTTMTVNKINGGTAVNIMAGECEFIWDIRSLPNENPQDYIDDFNKFCKNSVLPEMKKISPTTDIKVETRASTPALSPQKNSNAEALCKNITGDNQSRSVSFATEAGQFQQAGLSTAICGPGSIEQAHKPNEFISVNQLSKCTDLVEKLIQRMSN